MPRREAVLFFLESTFKDQINPKRQTAGPPEGGSPELDLVKGCAYKARDSDSGPTFKERRAQQQREKYAAVRGDAYKPRAKARGPRESFQARPSKRQRTQPDGEVVGSDSES